MRKSEVTGIAKLLESGEFETAEDAAAAIIKWLDEDRMKRTSYVGVLQFGTEKGKLFYVGMGPYPGRRSAENAVAGHPASGMASGRAVIPVTSASALDSQIKGLDQYKRPA